MEHDPFAAEEEVQVDDGEHKGVEEQQQEEEEEYAPQELNDEEVHEVEEQQQEQEEEQEEEDDPFPQAGVPTSSSASSNQPEIVDDTPLREFRAAFQKLCLEKDTQEAKQRQAMLDAGKAELKAFEAERAATMKTRAQSNRDEEKALISEIQATATSKGGSWARVVSLVDIQADDPAKVDTTRFRHILVQMKGSEKH